MPQYWKAIKTQLGVHYTLTRAGLNRPYTAKELCSNFTASSICVRFVDILSKLNLERRTLNSAFRLAARQRRRPGEQLKERDGLRIPGQLPNRFLIFVR